MRRSVVAAVLIALTYLCGCGTPANPKASPQASKPTTASSDVLAVDDNASDATTVARETTPAVDVTTEANSPEAAEVSAEPKVRKFTFEYAFRVKDLKVSGDEQKDRVRVWLPSASTTDCQELTRLDSTAPGEISENVEPRYGNRFLYFETQIPETGEFMVKVPYGVVRHEVLRGSSDVGDRLVEELDDMRRALLLGADTMVPTTGKSLKLLESVSLREDKLGLARQLYDIVDEHVVYKKEGTGWGRGDTNWVCDSRYGNCTDFHSLFMSLARSQGLPSRFEIGFSIPTDKAEGPIAGYHCWAWFYLDDRGWVPVDISEADKHPGMKEYYFGNLTADRVMFSVGRDLELVPKAEQPPLNFFIYPHIEVGGKELPKTNVELQFAFKDAQ